MPPGCGSGDGLRDQAGGTRSHRSRRRLIAIGSAILALGLTAWLLEPRLLFFYLRLHNSESDRGIAEKLARSREGVRLALEDLDVFGGSTGGWSNWILAASPLKEQVEAGLIGLADGGSVKPSKRIEAALLLCRRTHDPRYLKKLWALVEKPGSAEVGIGRSQLYGELPCRDGMEFVARTKVTDPLPLDEAGFSELLERWRSATATSSTSER